MNNNDTVYHKYFEGSGTIVSINGDVATVLWSKTNSVWQHPINTLRHNFVPQIWKSNGHL